ncbi:copper chaperone PCu(A)C [Dyella sp. C9]|uniref:copper chaperone PCu(A)C n=1 Tax=Dyella sp. C9 TaxID=2202154 RepID=UPI000DEEC974|nr:copper chaperone PCu(A)C [Dyella sp. C9]
MLFRVALTTACLALAVSSQALAGTADHVHVSQAWIRLLPGDLPAGAYAELANDGDAPEVLRQVSSPRFRHSMLHRSRTEGGMSRMDMVDELVVPAHGRVALSPGGFHLMLEGPVQPLQVGEQIPLRFEFADGSAVTAVFTVRPASALGPGD